MGWSGVSAWVWGPRRRRIGAKGGETCLGVGAAKVAEKGLAWDGVRVFAVKLRIAGVIVSRMRLGWEVVVVGA